MRAYMWYKYLVILNKYISIGIFALADVYFYTTQSLLYFLIVCKQARNWPCRDTLRPLLGWVCFRSPARDLYTYLCKSIWIMLFYFQFYFIFMFGSLLKLISFFWVLQCFSVFYLHFKWLFSCTLLNMQIHLYFNYAVQQLLPCYLLLLSKLTTATFTCAHY